MHNANVLLQMVFSAQILFLRAKQLPQSSNSAHTPCLLGVGIQCSDRLLQQMI